jgi:uncharacterized RDD family membrane protein YckC
VDIIALRPSFSYGPCVTETAVLTVDPTPDPTTGSYVSDRTTLRTPEGVGFDVTIAGLGSRSLAAIVDAIVQLIIVFVIGSASGGSFSEGGIGSAVVTVLVFLGIFGYFFICEALFKGRTLGKRITGLRVINDQGAPASARQIAVRNLVRLVDFLPLAYVIGISSIATSNRSQRLGDLAAGTIVIVEPASLARRRKKQEKLAVANGTAGPDNFVVVLTDEARQELASWDVIGITRGDIAIVRQFLSRRNTIDLVAREKIADEFAAKLRPRVQGVHPTIKNERFLELLVEAKQLKR